MSACVRVLFAVLGAFARDFFYFFYFRECFLPMMCLLINFHVFLMCLILRFVIADFHECSCVCCRFLYVCFPWDVFLLFSVNCVFVCLFVVVLSVRYSSSDVPVGFREFVFVVRRSLCVMLPPVIYFQLSRYMHHKTVSRFTSYFFCSFCLPAPCCRVPPCLCSSGCEYLLSFECICFSRWYALSSLLMVIIERNTD